MLNFRILNDGWLTHRLLYTVLCKSINIEYIFYRYFSLNAYFLFYVFYIHAVENRNDMIWYEKNMKREMFYYFLAQDWRTNVASNNLLANFLALDFTFNLPKGEFRRDVKFCLFFTVFISELFFYFPESLYKCFL